MSKNETLENKKKKQSAPAQKKKFFDEAAITQPQAPEKTDAPTPKAEHPAVATPNKKRVAKKKNAPSSESVQRFHADASKGLDQKQVQLRLEQGLYNKTAKKYSKTYRSIFVGNICTFFNLLCLLAAIALIVARAPITQFSFVLIFLCNIVFSIFQEIRAKRKIDKLTILSSPTALVIRGGKKTEIPVTNIVVDDVLLLTAGQQVPADCIALEGQAELNEALLTGESVPIKKEDGDPLFAGSFVASGKIAVRVDKLGDETYISKLTARAKTYKRPKSEIMNSINAFIRIIGIIIVPLAVGMFLNNYAVSNGLKSWSESMQLIKENGGFIHVLFSGSDELSNAIQKTCAVVLGMIPSGLLLLTTVAMSLGMIRLVKYNTLVQDMYSLEMLARVNVLCLDKTGTITDGRMRVSDCILLNNPTEYSVDDILGSMLASLDDNNQTSIALYERFGHSSVLQASARVPFSSQRKLSAVSFGDVGTFVLGAPEFVLKPMPARIDRLVKQYAQMGLRVMVLAHSPMQIVGDKIPSALRAITVITLSDNIRPDAIDTIKWFKENDVAVKVISGDNPVTVSEVARRAGVRGAAHFISLEGLSELEVESAASEYTVFGRVTPEQKAILIRAIKKAGNTVAMTGDGVNDILAMKEADCAVSVASGSEAARNVSNLVLQDNNFASMPKIVNEGRRVINNIKESASLYIMKTLLTLILACVCIFARTEYFFTTNNMLMYEMFISAVASVALALQPNTSRVKGKFIPFVLSRALPGAITMGLAVLSVFVVGLADTSGTFGFGGIMSGDSTAEYHALMMLTLTFTGLVMLFRICQPFNVFKTVLFVFVAALCILVISVPVLGNIVFDGWSAVSFSLPQILLLIIVIQAALPISSLLIRFFDLFNPADE
ncbi:MAG: HAD-IC family P-type ATPase [Clostridia bacterium]|nr:HAD-IC family P-type ATPase [Clostridia bacterium]